MDGRNGRIRGWERELIIGLVIILLALLKVMFDVRLTLRMLLAIAGVAVVALGVLFLARRASPGFRARLDQWTGDRRVWYGALAVVIAVAVLALSVRVEGLDSTVAGLESTVAGQEEAAAQARATETAQAAEAAALRASLVERETAAQATRTAQVTPTERRPEPTDAPTATPTPSPTAADGVGLYWARVAQGETQSAWNMLSPGFQSDGFAQGFDQYQQGMSDWLDTLCHVEVARAKAGNEAGENNTQVDVFMVYQIKPDCATVTHAFEYDLKRSADGDWLIDEVRQLD